MATCSAATLMGEARGFNSLSPQQLRVIIASLLVQILKQLNPMADCSAQALMAEADDFNALPEHTLQVLTVQLLCNLNAAGIGGVGAPELLRGNDVPVAAPTTDNSIYMRVSTNSLYWWNGSAWILFG